MRPSVALAGLWLAAAPFALAQTLEDLPTIGESESSAPSPTGNNNNNNNNNNRPSSTAAQSSGTTRGPDAASPSIDPAGFGSTKASSANTPAASVSFSGLAGIPTIAGVGIPTPQVPDTAAAPFMQKSDLPDGTVFICVGAILAFFGASILAWRGLVAWSLHRSVKRAARQQNLADIKAMSAVPGKKRGMYNVVGANSTMSLDHLSAAPIGVSKSNKPFAQNPAGTPPKNGSSLFFSPTAGGAAGMRDSVANRSSNYLPAGYYASGNAAPAGGSPMTQIGGSGQNLSVNSLGTPGNRFSARSGISPPHSPSLPPSRGYDRAPPSRDGISMYNRNSVATLGGPGNTRSGVYSAGNDNMSQLSLNVPGGTNVPGGRAPSAYLEDLFDDHGNGPRDQRY
jgi:hypothetical protein